jgi:hypothetical protein
MDSRLLQQELQSYFRDQVRAAEPASGWWANAVAHATEGHRPAAWRMSVKRSRLAWVLIPLAVLLLAGIAYASSSVIRELFMKLAPWVEHAGLSQELNLSQTVDGVTVKIERAYADGNAAVIGYTISGPPITDSGVGQRYFSRPGALSIAGGPSLQSSGNLGTVPGSKDVLGDWRPNDRLAVLAMFDTSTIEGAPAELKVTMPIQVYDRVPIPEAGTATVRSYSFDFTIKLHPVKTITVVQTVEASGVAITLDQVRIAPWETRVSFIVGPPYDGPDDDPHPRVTLTAPGGEPAESTSGRGNWHFFYSDFSSASGEWTAVISELNTGEVIGGETTEIVIDGKVVGFLRKGGETVMVPGPWVFHFNVP